MMFSLVKCRTQMSLNVNNEVSRFKSNLRISALKFGIIFKNEIFFFLNQGRLIKINP